MSKLRVKREDNENETGTEDVCPPNEVIRYPSVSFVTHMA